ncbi:MAG: TraR/DksA C4-type zinc finger protein [Nanoarchaeota archaeon]
MTLTPQKKAILKKKLMQHAKKLQGHKFSNSSAIDKMIYLADLKLAPLKENSEEYNFLHVHDALKRIQDGSYGKCKVCDNKISYRRLEILPHTPLCLDCKKKFER